jgi:hypothetical protein
MTVFADLSPYDPPPDPRPRVRVGWVGLDQPYATGSVLPAVCDRLAAATIHLRQGTDGAARMCEICDNPTEVMILSAGVQRVMLGMGELHIDGAAHRFVAPDLLLHYISAHQYAPPKPFIDAVLGLRDSFPSGSWRIDKHRSPHQSPVQAQLVTSLHVASFQPLPPHGNELWSAIATAQLFDPTPIAGGTLSLSQEYSGLIGLKTVSGRALGETEAGAMGASLSAALEQLSLLRSKKRPV